MYMKYIIVQLFKTSMNLAYVYKSLMRTLLYVVTYVHVIRDRFSVTVFTLYLKQCVFRYVHAYA